MAPGKQPVTIDLIQAKASTNQAQNTTLTLAKTEQAAKDRAQIIYTQELFATEYFCQSEQHENFGLAEPIPGPSCGEFQRLAKRCGVVVIASLFEKHGSGIYHNSAAIIDAYGDLTRRLIDE